MSKTSNLTLKLTVIEEYLRAAGWTGDGDMWYAPDVLFGDDEKTMRDAIALASGNGALHIYHAIMYQVMYDLWLSQQ